MSKVAGTVKRVNENGNLRNVILDNSQSFPTSYPQHSLEKLRQYIGKRVILDISPKGFLFDISEDNKEQPIAPEPPKTKVEGKVREVNENGNLREVILENGKRVPTSYPQHSLEKLRLFVGKRVILDISPKGFLFDIKEQLLPNFGGSPNEILSYNAMCEREGCELRWGIYPHLSETHSVILMSRRPDAPFTDDLQDEGKTLIYEGQNQPREMQGKLTNNGKFEQIVLDYKLRKTSPHFVRVYEKIEMGKWAYNGLFSLIDCWQENNGAFKFKLSLQESVKPQQSSSSLPWNRIIPSNVKQAVWKRDNGKCVNCGTDINLHFDHILPFSKGGTSLTKNNIQLLCMECNYKKSVDL